MFAPFCPTCAGEVLLGPRRIVSFAWDGTGDRPLMVLRCFCGALLDWDEQRASPDAAVGAHLAERSAR